MKTNLLLTGAAFAALGLSSAANAGIVYSNPAPIPGSGNCAFSTTCAAAIGAGDDFAAQAFTLSSADVLTGAGFTELDLGVTPTDANWGIIAADGPGGSPGTILASGTNTIERSQFQGTDGFYTYDQERFRLGTVALAAGTYYLAIQAVSPVFDTYLSGGVNNSGAYETRDGGVTWALGYRGFGGVSTIIFDANSGVPEPATWALMLVGVGGVGATLRRKQRTALAAV